MSSLKSKIKSIPFVYDRATLFFKIKIAKSFKEKILIILLDLVKKFFRKRNDFFEISTLINSIHDQYIVGSSKSKIDFRPLETGLYGSHDPKTLSRKKDYLENMQTLDIAKRSFSYQGKIALLHYAVYGGDPDYYKAKEGETFVSDNNYPILKDEDYVLGPDWYLAIGHICLLGFFGLAYPKKFTLIIVEGSNIANKALLETISTNFKIIKCNPITYSSLIISQPKFLYSVDSTRFYGLKDPVKEYVSKALSILPKNSYKFKKSSSRISDFLDHKYLKDHRVFSKFITLHVRGSSRDDPNSINTPPRNASISSYIESIKFLVNLGFNVVRIGDYKSAEIPYINGFIDTTQFRRDNNQDIGLLANAKFHIGTSSGPINVPPLFGVPVLLTNSVRPLSQSRFPMSFAISKRCLNTVSKKFMSYSSFLKSDIVYEEQRRVFENNNFLMDNSSEEIIEAVRDMVKLIDFMEKDFKNAEKIYMDNLKNYEDFLKKYDIERFDDHMPLAPSFLKKIQ